MTDQIPESHSPLDPPVSILFVCLGNICRSPMAEGIFLSLIDGDPRFTVDSAGTGSWHVGEAPDPRARAVCLDNGIVLESRGRQVTAADLETFDIVIAMDQSNLAELRRLLSNTSTRGGGGDGSLGTERLSELYLLRSLDPTSGPPDLDVPDPYWDDDGFQGVFEMLRRSLEVLLDQLESRMR